MALVLAFTSPAWAVRPTPHQLIDQALRPIREQLAQLNATPAERREVADVLERGEALAAELLEAQRAGSTERSQSITRRIELLGRLVRGRIEASREEVQAVESERLALDTDARRVQARAALERAVERRLELERAAVAAPSPAANPAPANTTTAPANPPAANSTPPAPRPRHEAPRRPQ
jgi:hypothetical protein